MHRGQGLQAASLSLGPVAGMAETSAAQQSFLSTASARAATSSCQKQPNSGAAARTVQKGRIPFAFPWGRLHSPKFLLKMLSDLTPE